MSKNNITIESLRNKKRFNDIQNIVTMNEVILEKK